MNAEPVGKSFENIAYRLQASLLLQFMYRMKKQWILK